jgi:23S rRNA (cytidine1920-2'-O)/16S rRNA (cytidine1409-2'-O)-methyltransferase
MAKKRADIILHEKGLVESREKGKRVIMEGSVYVGEKRVDKPGEYLDETVEIHIRSNPLPYVSRGGLKLEKAMAEFGIDLEGSVCMDMGASTGGFTDCMLQSGAKKVYAVDVGYGQLDWRLRNDPRVVVMERTNIRYMENDSIEDRLDFISIDVSFISLKHILPVASAFLKENGKIAALVKPQFEAGRDKVGKKGIVRDRAVHKEVIQAVIGYGKQSGLYPEGLTFSPITGTTGNIEFLMCLSKNNMELTELEIEKVLDEAHDNLG